MSAAVTRTNRVEHDTHEFAQAETSVPVKLEARPVVEDHGMTPLMRAASDGSAGTVQALLDRGADVNAKRMDGFNALALAAFFGHAQVVWLLIENGADLAPTGRSETLPEMWADIRGFTEIGDTLREARATKQVETTNPCASVIAEPARFARAAETEKFEPAGVVGSDLEVSGITESVDPEATLVRPRARVDEESQSSVIEASPESTLEINPETVVQEIQPLVIDGSSDPEATLVRPRSLVNEANQASAIDPAADPEVTLVSTRAPLSQESTPRRVEPLEDIFPSGNPEQVQKVPVINPPIRVLKTLPEIEDPPPLVTPEFHPGSVFVARITSSRKNLLALVVVVWLAFCAVAAFLFQQIRKPWADGQPEVVTKTANLPAESSSPIAGETSVSGSVETPTGATTEPAKAPASNEIEENAGDSPTDTPASSKNFESSSRVDSTAEMSESSGTNALARGSESRADSESSTSAANTVHESPGNKRELTAATSISRSVVSARKQRSVSRAGKLKPQTSAEEPPKPAPLSVEVSRSRTVLSAPVRSTNEVPGSQPPPLSIISGKPKSKVIQWP